MLFHTMRSVFFAALTSIALLARSGPETPTYKPLKVQGGFILLVSKKTTDDQIVALVTTLRKSAIVSNSFGIPTDVE